VLALVVVAAIEYNLQAPGYGAGVTQILIEMIFFQQGCSPGRIITWFQNGRTRSVRFIYEPVIAAVKILHPCESSKAFEKKESMTSISGAIASTLSLPFFKNAAAETCTTAGYGAAAR
jgi:hypothetical protein